MSKPGFDIYRQSGWYRGENCNFYPNPNRDNSDLLTLPEYIEKYILSGWLPTSPFIRKGQKITSIGSCFAQRVLRHLMEKGLVPSRPSAEEYTARFSAGMFHTFAILQQFDWVFLNKTFEDDIWYENPDTPTTSTIKDKAATKQLLSDVDVFIFTLGLSEIWYSKITGNVFWKGIPGQYFESSKHGFRLSTVQENKENLQKTLRIIESSSPSAKIIFSISPVTLVATFRKESCIVANYVSKSILHAALDEVIREYQGPLSLFYWPSYEIIQEFKPDSYCSDKRHPSPEYLKIIFDLFDKYYLVP